MINVGVISSKSEVAFNMASVVCRLGSHCETLYTYEFEKIKAFNIVVLDLDNTEEWHEQIKKDAAGFEGFVIIGMTRDTSLIDAFSPLFKVDRKPLRAEHIKSAITKLKEVIKTDTVVNTEPSPVYTATGNPTFDRNPINTDVFSDEEMSKHLSKIINEKYKGPSEKQMLNKIELSNIEVQSSITTVPLQPKPLTINLVEQFVDDALIMYRAKKLRQQKRMSQEEVFQKIKELVLFDASRNSKPELLASSELEDKLISKGAVLTEKLAELDLKIPNVQSKQPMDFDDSKISIEDQRREAIGMHEYKEEIPENNAQASSSDKFSDAELKYIKRDTTNSEPKKHMGSSGVDLNTAEVTKKLQQSMTPEQIEKLRKLGIKI
jgi:hypothetical protein